MAVIQKFRTALGGFNRQDVQTYIEQAASAHQLELEELRKRLEGAEQHGRELEFALSSAETAKSGAAAEEAKVRASLETSTRSLSRLRGELSQTESKLMVAKQELERLQAQVGRLEPMADSYAQLKDRVATVELDAHRKAQATIEEAEAQAKKIRQAGAKWLEELFGGYEALREQVNACALRAEEVRRMFASGDERCQELMRHTAQPEEESAHE